MSAGAAKLSEFDRARRRHAQHYTAWATTAGQYCNGDLEHGGRGQFAALYALRLELDNLRATLEVQAGRRQKAGLAALASALNPALELAGEFLLLRHSCQLLLDCTNRRDVQFQARLGLTTSLRRLGRPAAALDHALQALKLALKLDLPAQKIAALRSLAQCQLALGQNAEARETLQHGLELAQDRQNVIEWVALLNTLGTLDFRQGRYAEARQRLRRAAEILHGLGNPDAEARTLTNLGLLEIRHGNLSEARRLFEVSLQIALALGNHREAAIRLANLGSIASDSGRTREARSYYGQALDEICQTGERGVQATLLGNLGMVARDEQDYMHAATLLGQAYEIHVELGNRLGQAEILRFMAIVSFLLQDPQQAALYLLRSLEMCQEFGAAREIALTAGLAGTLLAQQGDLMRGALLLHGALHQEELHSYRFEDDVRSILHDGLDEITNTVVSRGGLSGADKQRAQDTARRMGLDELGLMTARTLRERFAWAASRPA